MNQLFPEIANRIYRYNPTKVIIFGDYLTKPNQASELAILVVLNCPPDQFRDLQAEISVAISHLLADQTDWTILVTNPETLAANAEDPNQYYHRALTSGQIIFEK